jgi:NADH-quinone oxidoreductase subunit L
VARPLVEPSGTQELFASLGAVALGVAGAVLAWSIYGARTVGVPSARLLRALLEHKFYFDELYDWVFYRPALWLARGLRDYVERPFVQGSLTGIAAGARRLGDEVTELQTGVVRTYAFAIAGGVAVLAFVFVWVK